MGGTKINFFLIERDASFSKYSIPTTNPDDFKKYVVSKFSEASITKIIFACFGPISLSGHNYGEILQTPKKGWQNCNLYSWLKDRVCEDIILTTDVTLPALGSIKKYNLKDKFFSYITVGTGIGGCNVFKGTVLQNEMHSEIGHSLLGPSEDSFCEYHNHCFEGQASGNYFSGKYNLQFKDINPDHAGWLDLISKLVRLIYNLFTILGVDCVVVGGGVIRKDMKPWVIDGVLKINNSYLPLLNKTDADKRIIFNENSEELSLLGGVYLI
jgi:fructokinase